jgi:diaminohydroxyphosphoribosylaminopyrimidine deaminase/5-amino-6-(5-phosphoribosylamino)uracil reductase
LNHHTPYIQRALALAATRRGYCAPNPAVGAVIVKEGIVIGEGAHQACGKPHAEVEALNALQQGAVGATIYVTLEPCCHHGRTPPCTQAILNAGITTVVYSYSDPNPTVAGKGHQQLAEAGLKVIQLSLPEVDQFYESYRYWLQHQRPRVTAKIALSLDGKIAGPEGQRLTLTGPELKQQTYYNRRRSDAILTTAKTLLHDNPFLDVRCEDKIESKPLYILDRQLRLPKHLQIWQNTLPITVFYSGVNSGKLQAQMLQGGVTYTEINEQDGQLDLQQILHHLGMDGVHDCWVEAGGILLNSLLQDDAVDELQVYCAPKWLGPTAQSAFKEGRVSFEQFTQKKWYQVGDDVVCKMSKSNDEER